MIEPTSAEKSPEQQVSNTVIRAATILALGNIISRMLGLGRDSVITGLFGARLASAYDNASLIPNTLFDAIRGGLVDSSLVPVFSDLANREDRAVLWQAVSTFLSVLIVFLIGVVLLVELFYQPVAWAIGIYESNDPEWTAITISLMRLAMPAVLFLSVASTLTGLLYSLKRFTIPAFLPAVLNGSIVVVALLRPTHVSSLIFGFLLGSILQVAIQFPALRDVELRWNFNFRHPIIGRILKLFAPIVLGQIVNLAVITFSYNLANRTGESSVNYMRRAVTLVQFPMGLVVTALSIAILPVLAQQASAQLTQFKATLASGIRLVLVLILPATAGLFALAIPIVDLLFGHGEYTALDVDWTARVLQLYLVGLPFAAVDQMLIFGSYAREDTLRPAVVGVISMIINAAVAVAFLDSLGLFSIMLADVVKHITHTAMMVWLLRRHLGGLGGHGIALTTAKAAIAALVTGGIAYFSADQLLQRLPATTLSEVIIVLGAGAIGVAVYLLFVYLFNIREAKDLLRRRF